MTDDGIATTPQRTAAYLKLMYIFERSCIQFLQWTQHSRSLQSADNSFYLAVQRVVEKNSDDTASRGKAGMFLPLDLAKAVLSSEVFKSDPAPAPWRRVEGEKKQFSDLIAKVTARIRNPIMHGGLPKNSTFQEDAALVHEVVTGLRNYLGSATDEVFRPGADDESPAMRAGNPAFFMSKDELVAYCRAQASAIGNQAPASGLPPKLLKLVGGPKWLTTRFRGHSHEMFAPKKNGLITSDTFWSDAGAMYVACLDIGESEIGTPRTEDRAISLPELRKHLPDGARVGVARYVPYFVAGDPLEDRPHWLHNSLPARCLVPCFWLPSSK